MRRSLEKRAVLVFTLLSIMAAALFLNSSLTLPVTSVDRWESRICACPKCLRGGDLYFTELIKAAPKPFLMRDTTSERDFKWWKGLQKGKGDFALYNATLNSLFQLIPPHPDVNRTMGDSCTSCAVVGNSGVLRDSHYGPLIDYHDIVIRMNRGHTKGFEKDVGSKTTHHIFYPESATTLDNTTRLVFFPYKIADLLWLQKKIKLWNSSAAKAKRIPNKDLVLVLSPKFMKYVQESWLKNKGRYPSTGFLALVLLMQMCDEVDVFGFGADKDGNWNHYFEKLKNKRIKTGPHAGNLEYKIIQQLSKKEKIRLF